MKNKKLKRPKSRKKMAALLALAFLILGLAYWKLAINNSDSVRQEDQASAEQADVDSAKQRAEEETQGEPLKQDEENVSADSAATTSGVTLSALTFSQSSGVVNSSFSVAGAQTGGCKFIFTDGDGRAITKIAQLSAGRCSISTPEVEFTMIGEYNLTAKFGEKTISKTITIN